MLKPYRCWLSASSTSSTVFRRQANLLAPRAARSACIFTNKSTTIIDLALPTKLDAWSWNFSPRSTWESSGLGSAAIGSHGQRTEV